jgi:RNA polymerase sigma factor (sigma-70 family)
MSLGLAVLPFAPSAEVRHSSLSDKDLLGRFFRKREDAAFAAIVERHGPLVYGVCRRVLRDANDLDDAFQATFLVLVRKGATLQQPERLANWLFGVAYRTARKIKLRAAARGRFEREAGSAPRALPANHDVGSLTLDELRAILDQEISALPEKYALPLALCYLEGQTNAEAAEQLGWPEGSMSRRLSRGRELLKSRLIRRGLELSAVLVAAVFARTAIAAPPPALVEATASAGSLVAQGAPLSKVVSAQAAAVIGQFATGIVSVKLAASAVFAAAAVFLAVSIGVSQFNAPNQGSAFPFALFGQPNAAQAGEIPAAATTDMPGSAPACTATTYIDPTPELNRAPGWSGRGE